MSGLLIFILIGNELPSLALYPNPMQDRFSLKIPQESTQVAITVYNSLRQELPIVQQQDGTLITVALNAPPGMYLVHVTLDGTTSIHKVIRQ
ncbi:MAG: T9SS type A sorting domain-containing protein [Flavobacteriaceae bacterium]